MVSDFRSVQEKISSKDTEGAMATILPKIANAVSDLSDGDVDAILFPCLSVVSREHMKGWVPVCQHGEMAFDDIDLLTMPATGGAGGRRLAGNFCKDSYQRDAHPASGITFNSLPGGEDFILRPALAFHIDQKDLNSGAVDLCRIALLNDYLDMREDNDAR